MAASVVYTTFAGQIVSENRGGVVKEYLTDTLGSTIALATTDAITDTWDYWPYGEEMSRTGTTPTPFTFVGVLGYFKDLLDKLFYVRARHYQPNYGRWLTVDPLWPAVEEYGYCRNRPQGQTDPSGLFPWKLLKECGLEVVGMIGDIVSGGRSDADWCKLGTACLAGILGFLIGLLVGGAAAGCVSGAVAALLGTLFEYLCDPPGPCETRDLACVLTDAFIAAIAGCIGGLFGDSVVEQITNVIRTFMYGLVSGSMGAQCSHLDFPADFVGPPPNVV